MTSYAVIGGGVAGLVVARRLALGGASVTVFEGGDRFGGTVSEHTVGGISLDAGAESFATRGGAVAELASEVGLGDDIVAPLDRPAWLYRASGSPLPLPATSLLGIPSVPLAADVIAVVGLPTALRAYLDVVLGDRVGRNETTLGGLVARRMGRGMLERLVTPVVRGVHSAHPDDLAIDRVAPQLRAAIRSEGSLSHGVGLLRSNSAAGSAIAGIRGGVHRLVIELLADLERLGVTLELDARVTEVNEHSVVVNGSRLFCVPVVAAAGVIEQNQRRPISIVTLVVDVPELDAAPRGTGMLVADGAPGIQARALTHSTAKWPWLAERTGGLHVLRLSYDSAPADLEETARRDAATMLGVDLPASSVRDVARVDWSRPTSESSVPTGIVTVGEAAGGTGLAAVVSFAEATATRLLDGSEHGPTPDGTAPTTV